MNRPTTESSRPQASRRQYDGTTWHFTDLAHLLHQRRSLMPEQLLMLAVLEDAALEAQRFRVFGFTAKRHTDLRRQQEADLERLARWLNGEGHPTLTLEECCDAVNLDAAYVRSGLRRQLAGVRTR